MSGQKHMKHSVRTFGVTYPSSWSQRLYTVLTPLVVVGLLLLLLRYFAVVPFAPNTPISWPYIGGAVLATLARLAIAYAFALVCSVPLAILVAQKAWAERILFPLFDIIESVPVLAFFPLIVIFLLRFGWVSAAAIFIIFLSMLWNMVFNLIGGLKVIPTDIKSAAQVFHIRGFSYIWRILLPASMPYLITGSLLAWAQGWNIIIVAEVLHTYVPGASANLDLYGIGSILVHASASGQNALFAAAIIALVTVIALFNLFIWQRLLHYSERFKFE